MVVEPLDLSQLIRFLISAMQQLVGLSEEAMALMAALESVKRWINGLVIQMRKQQTNPFEYHAVQPKRYWILV